MSYYYTKEQLGERSKIMQSQDLFGKFLDADIINKLIHLFDSIHNNYVSKNDKIIKYIEDERRKQGLDDTNILIESEVYGYTVENSTLYLSIKKNNKDFIHLTIHIAPKELKPTKTGLIHIYKEIYKNINKSIPKQLLYALISVKQPIDKPNSLEFNIADGYNTVGVPNSHLYDPEIQKEMNVIVTVLNNIFDENNKEYYIGNKFYPIHNKTDIILKNINTRTKYTVRKNIGKMILPELSNTTIFNLKRKNNKNKYIKKNKRVTQKRKKYTNKN